MTVSSQTTGRLMITVGPIDTSKFLKRFFFTCVSPARFLSEKAPSQPKEDMNYITQPLPPDGMACDAAGQSP